jgi:crotonobetainyl-CoA:carnitine CoA-transferase CaiB-like acyl-CoA transferase
MLNREILSGIRILEWGEGVCAPYCAKILSDLGADVIKIESPLNGDCSRRRGPFINREDGVYPNQGGLFLLMNTNKKGITLNPSHPQGRELFIHLVKEMDCLIEDRPPGEMKIIGLDPSVLLEVNPSLVITSITPFGQSGPYSHYKAYPLNTFHGGGSGYCLPFEDDNVDKPPVRLWRHACEIECGATAALATLSGIFYSMITGEGQHIDISKQEALMNLERMDLGRFPNDGELISRARRPYRMGGRFPCKNGYVVILPVQENQWQGLIRILGNPPWASDEICKDEFTRAEHSEEIHSKIREIILSMEKEELYRLGQIHGVPISPIFDVAELLMSEQLSLRGFFAPVGHPELGQILLPTLPYLFAEGMKVEYEPPPGLGQDNEEVFCGLLGLSKEELEELKREGIV